MDVAILGGGIAGLATAIPLKQLGMTVNVYERRDSVHNLGAGIVCWPIASFDLFRKERRQP
ncbi:MAG: FAD-dependent oxidoreductase [Xanthomonadales bacterium]|nr:FAD-dependent oxidoreductase [Xanthomonadales bacterium]